MAPNEAVRIYVTARRTGGRVPPGFWGDRDSARMVLRHILRQRRIRFVEAHTLCSKRWFERNGLSALLKRYDNSPARLFTDLFGHAEPTNKAAQFVLAPRLTCPKCTRWFRPARLHLADVRCCPYCGKLMGHRETTESAAP